MRDLQLIALGMLMMQHDKCDEALFGTELKPLAVDAMRRKASKYTVGWLRVRGVDVNGSVVDSILSTLGECSSFCETMRDFEAFRDMRRRNRLMEKHNEQGRK